jgi:hypothetical protein
MICVLLLFLAPFLLPAQSSPRLPPLAAFERVLGLPGQLEDAKDDRGDEPFGGEVTPRIRRSFRMKGNPKVHMLWAILRLNQEERAAQDEAFRGVARLLEEEWVKRDPDAHGAMLRLPGGRWGMVSMLPGQDGAGAVYAIYEMPDRRHHMMIMLTGNNGYRTRANPRFENDLGPRIFDRMRRAVLAADEAMITGATAAAK